MSNPSTLPALPRRPVAFEIDSSVDADLTEQLAVQVRSLAFLLPSWVDKFFLNVMASDQGDTVAKVDFLYSYREAHLYVYPNWFAKSPASRRSILIHEFAHLGAAALSEFAFEAARQAGESLRPLWTNAMEATVSDVARVYEALLDDQG